MTASDRFARYAVAGVIGGYCSLVIGAVLLLLEINATENKAADKTEERLFFIPIHSSDSYEETETSQSEERIKRSKLAIHKRY